MKTLAIRGVGLWSPGYKDAEAWCARRRDSAVQRPSADLIPSRQRRRLSALSRAIATAFGEATAQAAIDPAVVPTVFGSTYGESLTLLKLLDQLHDEDGELSPMQFAGSVHNTASGALSIAVGAKGFSTSIAAGQETLGACLCEAAALLADGAEVVAVVLGDSAPPAPLVPEVESFETLAVALVLSYAADAGALALVDGLERTVPRPPSPDTLAALGSSLRFHPCAPAVLLLDAIAARRDGALLLDVLPERSDGRAWEVKLRFPTPAEPLALVSGAS